MAIFQGKLILPVQSSNISLLWIFLFRWTWTFRGFACFLLFGLYVIKYLDVRVVQAVWLKSVLLYIHIVWRQICLLLKLLMGFIFYCPLVNSRLDLLEEARKVLIFKLIHQLFKSGLLWVHLNLLIRWCTFLLSYFCRAGLFLNMSMVTSDMRCLLF